MKNTLLTSLLLLLCGNAVAGGVEDPWELVFADPGKGNWQQHWFVEGLKAKVSYDNDGSLVFSSGPVPRENASHAVLWTRQDFSGDVRIEYDYTRLDSMMDVNSVNILYIQATGLGTEESPTDILLSTKQREIPWMKYYFLNMNTVHISYATTGPKRAQYVSARRYPANDEANFEKGTQIQPVYENIDLFQTGETYHMTVVKEGHKLTLTAEREGQTHTFEWDTSEFPPVKEGRIGLRHMWARSARYENFRVYQKRAPMAGWTFYGNGFTAAVDDATLISEYPGSKGVMLVSPDDYGDEITVRFDIMPLNPESVLVAILSASNAGAKRSLAFPADYDGSIGPLVSDTDAYFFAFHNAAHNRTPFVRKHPFIRGESEDLDAHESNVMTTEWHHVEVTRNAEGMVAMSIDGKQVLNAVDGNPLPGGEVILRLRGTPTHTATALIRNLEISTGQP